MIKRTKFINLSQEETKRKCKVEFRCTAEEKTTSQMLADELGVSLSTLIRISMREFGTVYQNETGVRE